MREVCYSSHAVLLFLLARGRQEVVCAREKLFCLSASAGRGDTAATQAPALLPPRADIQPWPQELIKLHFFNQYTKKIINEESNSWLNLSSTLSISRFSPPSPPSPEGVQGWWEMLHNFPGDCAKANREGGACRALPTSLAEGKQKQVFPHT